MQHRHRLQAQEGLNHQHDGEEANDSANKDTFLSASVHGSPRHLRGLARNALHLVSEKGLCTMFITGTTNINWPEILSQLLPGQTAFSRPDVTTQVFKAKLDQFIHNLKNGK